MGDPIRDEIITRVAEALRKDGIECSVVLSTGDWKHVAVLFSVKIEEDDTLTYTRHRGVDYALNLDVI